MIDMIEDELDREERHDERIRRRERRRNRGDKVVQGNVYESFVGKDKDDSGIPQSTNVFLGEPGNLNQSSALGYDPATSGGSQIGCALLSGDHGSDLMHDEGYASPVVVVYSGENQIIEVGADHIDEE